MLLQNKKVAIIGAGPGGLTLARLLQQQGVDVKVYERDRDQNVRQQGATLDLHYESGLKALREAGLIKEFQQSFRPGSERVTIVDNRLEVHYSERDNEPLQDLNSIYARPEIDRGPLRDLLIASLNPNTVVWNSKFVELKKSGSGWELVFAAGDTAYADFVIASDGANSKVRKYITPIERIYSGVTIVEGNIYNAAVHAPRLWNLTNGGKIFAHWNGKTIILSAKGEGSLSFYTITEESQDLEKAAYIDFSNKEQVFTWFKQRFFDWSTDWHEIFSTNDAYFIARPQYYFPKDQTWETVANLTVIGDAAHQTPPSGDGVNQAMLDALEFYETMCLENFTTLDEALASFEKKMLARTSVATEEALQLIRAMLSKDSLQWILAFFTENKAL